MDDNFQKNNSRIARNTLILYLRMAFIMIITLYISRVVLNKLGVVDYGIYNVVGGFVSIFSLISGSMATTISRFLTFELGKDNKGRLSAVFSTSVNIQIGLSAIIVVLAEIVGLWFLNEKMNIPAERMNAAIWVFHCSLIAFCVNLISVPYNSVIIAHEKMSSYAYFSICDVVLKLVIALSLSLSPFDMLVFYAILLLIESILMRIGYGLYCSRYFEESKYQFILDKSILKEMSSFASWNYLGAGAYILRTQGLNVLMNLFFGVTINAARGIATQVESAVKQFVSNFTLAINPQIIKSYANGDKVYMHQLVCIGAKYAYYLILVVIIPIVAETPYILKLWLSIVPDNTVIFLRLALIAVLFDSLSDTLSMAMLASSNIKNFHIVVSGIVLLVLPVSYVLYVFGAPAYVSYIVCAVAMVAKLFGELPLLKRMVGLPVVMYLRMVIARVIPVTLLAAVLPIVLIWTFNESFLRVVGLTFLSIIWTLLIIYGIGLTTMERIYFQERLKFFLKRVK